MNYKNQKGFTLVEVLTVIGIIALVTAIAAPSVYIINKNMKNKSLNAKINLLLDSARLYAQEKPNSIKKVLDQKLSYQSCVETEIFEDGSGCECNNGNCQYVYVIDVNFLVENGMYKSEKLDEGDTCNVTNPKDTNKCLDDYKIEIRISDKNIASVKLAEKVENPDTDNSGNSGSNSNDQCENSNNYPILLTNKLNCLYNPNNSVLHNGYTYSVDTTNNLIYDGYNGIRYYGTDAKNFINIGDTYGNGYYTLLWRIIGIFKDVELADGTKRDVVKIIRESGLDEVQYDIKTDSSSTVSNEWENAELQRILNTAYFNADPNVGYANLSSFSGLGLEEIARERVAEVKWKIQGISSNATSADLLKPENELKTWTGKIGLMSMGDYAFATNFFECYKPLSEYYQNVSGCINTNYLHQSVKGNTVFLGYTLSLPTTKANSIWIVGDAVYGPQLSLEPGQTAEITVDENNKVSARPVLYLDPDLILTGGNGTIDNPYTFD